MAKKEKKSGLGRGIDSLARNNKNSRPSRSGVLCFSPFRRLLAGSDGLGRADAGASAAVDADVRVDGVDIAFVDGAGRAFALAGSASHAEVRIDYVSHSSDSLNVSVLLLVCKFKH